MMAINKLVLIIIFLIILIVGLMLLTTFVLPYGLNFDLQNQVKECCQNYRAYGCPRNENDILGITCPNGKNLHDLKQQLGMSANATAAFCNC